MNFTELYRIVNSKLSGEVKLGAIGDDCINKTYGSDENILGCLEVFGVLPPIPEEEPLEKDSLSQLFLNAVAKQGIIVTKSPREYKDVLMNIAEKYKIPEKLFINSYLKAQLNILRHCHYEQLKYQVALQSLPENIEEQLFYDMDVRKNLGMLPIYDNSELGVKVTFDTHKRLSEEIKLLQAGINRVLNIAKSADIIKREMSEEEHTLIEQKLKENEKIISFVLSKDSNNSMLGHFYELEMHRLANMTLGAIDFVTNKEQCKKVNSLTSLP